MNKITVIFSLILGMIITTGCASTPPSQTLTEESSKPGFMASISGAAGNMLKAVSDFGAYTNGTEITEENLSKIQIKTTNSKQLIAMLGHPQRTESKPNGELWYYDFTKIRHIGSNINESNVFRINSSKIVIEHYKTQGRSSATGNPLIDTANGIH